MSLNRRSKERRSGRSRRANTTWATEILDENHLRILDLFDDFDDPLEGERLNEIRELALEEIRLHRALVEDALLPAMRQATGNPAALSNVQTALSRWEPLIIAAERIPIEDLSFQPAWQALRKAVLEHIDEGDLGTSQPPELLKVNFVALGLRMIELRNQILLEKPGSESA